MCGKECDGVVAVVDVAEAWATKRIKGPSCQGRARIGLTSYPDDIGEMPVLATLGTRLVMIIITTNYSRILAKSDFLIRVFSF